MAWKLQEKLRERLAQEKGYYVYPRGTRHGFALAYPNVYRVGMSNLGIHIIYDILNKRSDTACERFFLPDKKEIAEYERTRTPLFSMETQTPLQQFGVIGFAVSFEMDYFNLLTMLRLGRVTELAAERAEHEPLVIAGGPCSTFNPEPLSLFVDAFIIGEGEETVSRFLDVYYAAKDEGLSKREALLRVAKLPGVYVPSLYRHEYAETGELQQIIPLAGAPVRVTRQWVRDLDAYPAHTVVLTDDTEFNLYLIETARGCGRHCRFCMAGYCFRRPRNRSLQVLKDELAEAKQYGKRVGLMGAAISDYPEIDELATHILGEEMTMSVASFRADSVTETLLNSLVQSGMRTLTMAPEAGSSRMRAVINKGIEEKHLFRAMDLGIKAGIAHFRMYIMIGLPFEEAEDIAAISDLALRMKRYLEKNNSRGTLTLSVNPFIPKPFTPFQWAPMADKKSVEAKLKSLKQGIGRIKGIELLAESPREAYIQGILARGDRRISQVLYQAHQAGGAANFKREMKQAGLRDEDYLTRERDEDEVFPWDILDMGLKRGYLYHELEQARDLKQTIQCFDGCRRCGVCQEG